MKPCVLDFETSISKGVHGPSAKDPSNDIYTTIVGLNPNDIIVRHHAKGFKRNLMPDCRKMVEGSTHIVGHNLGFDLEYIFHNQWVKDYFINGGKLWDTQVAEYILSAQQHKFASLGELQAKYMQKKVKIDRISRLYKKKIGADEIIKARRRCPKLFKLYVEYSRLDGSSTLEVFKAQHARAKREGMLYIIALYNDYLLSIINMACSGITIDIPKAQELEREYNLKHLEYLSKAQDILATVWVDYRLPKFNVNSTIHKSCALFGGAIKVKINTYQGKYKNGKDHYKLIETLIPVEGMGVDSKLSRPTKSGFSTDEAVVEKIYRDSDNKRAKEYCYLQKKAMAYTKTLNTYVRAFINLSVKGILYVNLNNVQTITSRLSSSEPNMQNIAKHNKFGKDLHSLLIAPEGYTCVQADYSQLEIYVMAWLSGDKRLYKDLVVDKLDLHCVRVGYFVKESYEEIYRLAKTENIKEWSEKRSDAKGVGYLMAYGGGAKKISEEKNVPIETVKRIFDKEKERYPDAFGLGDSVLSIAKKNQRISYKANSPTALHNKAKGPKIKGSIELMPIFDKEGNVSYNDNYIRNLGYWKSPTGKKYHFPETGRFKKNAIVRSLPYTKTKNYPMQGTAADIQGASSAALTKWCMVAPELIQQINEVHDSKWFYVLTKRLDFVVTNIADIMENIPKLFKERFDLDVPFRFPVDIETGPNFAELKPYVLKQESE